MNEPKKGKRKPRKPAAKYPGVRVRWSSRLDRWTFRAVVTISGKRVPGAQRLTQEEASDDYRRMRAREQKLPVQVAGLGDALRAVLEDARGRGVPESTLKRHHESHSRYILKFFSPDSLLVDLAKSDLVWFVQAAREAGRHPNTLIQKDLPLIAQAFELAGLPNIVADVRRELRRTLKMVAPRMQFFEAAEVRSIVQRMRAAAFSSFALTCPACSKTFKASAEHGLAGQCRPCTACGHEVEIADPDVGRNLQIESRQVDADLVELLALTGLRAGELGRIALRDVDERRRTIFVLSKDRSNPRVIEIFGQSEVLVQRLLAHARERGAQQGDPLVPDSMNRITNLCRRWKARLGEPRLSGRALRHSFVTGLLYTGAAAVEAKGLAGHKSLTTTNRYIHEITRRRAGALQRWQSELDGSAGGGSHPGEPEREESGLEP